MKAVTLSWILEDGQFSLYGLLICMLVQVEPNTGKEVSIPVQQTNQPAIKQTQKPSDEKSGGDKMET